MLHHLSLDDVRAAHAVLVELHQAGQLEQPMGAWTRGAEAGWSAALAALFPSYGVDRYPTLEHKAARLLLGGCVVAHPLPDGNKRLATLSLHRQLLVNGYSLEATNDEIIDLVISSIEAEQQGVQLDALVEIVAGWIAERLVPLA